MTAQIPRQVETDLLTLAVSGFTHVRHHLLSAVTALVALANLMEIVIIVVTEIITIIVIIIVSKRHFMHGISVEMVRYYAILTVHSCMLLPHLLF